MGWGQMRTRCEPAMSTFISVLKVDIDQGVRPDKFVPGPILSPTCRTRMYGVL